MAATSDDAMPFSVNNSSARSTDLPERYRDSLDSLLGRYGLGSWSPAAANADLRTRQPKQTPQPVFRGYPRARCPVCAQDSVEPSSFDAVGVPTISAAC